MRLYVDARSIHHDIPSDARERLLAWIEAEGIDKNLTWSLTLLDEGHTVAVEKYVVNDEGKRYVDRKRWLVAMETTTHVCRTPPPLDAFTASPPPSTT